MATKILTREQGTPEIRTYDCDFNDDLRAGVTVSSVAAVHTPPSGSAVTPTIGTISAGVAPVTVPALAVLGLHQVKVTATLSDGDKSTILLLIPVNY